MLQPVQPNPGRDVPKVLIADDQPSVIEALAMLLKSRGVGADVAANPSEVVQKIQTGEYELLLMDMNYDQDTTSGAEGLRLVDWVRQIDPSLGIVVMTAWSTVDLAVAALQRGAADFIQKPWDNGVALRIVEEQMNRTVRRRTEDAVARAEREQARQVQRSLMGASNYRVGGLVVAAESHSSRMLGGDFYDVVTLDGARAMLCVADVMGKGLGAGLVMSNFQAQFRAAVANHAGPGQVCEELNEKLSAYGANERLVTAFLGVIDGDDPALTYTCAGHIPPLLMRDDGSIERLTTDDAVLGGIVGWNFRASTIQLKPGDRVLIVTDGFTEATNGEGEEAGEERISFWLSEVATESAETIKQHLSRRLREYCGAGLADDATVMVIESMLVSEHGHCVICADSLVKNRAGQ